MSIDLSKLTAEELAELKAEIQTKEKKKKDEIKQSRKTYKELSNEYVQRNIDALISHKVVTEDIIKKLFADYNAVKEIKKEIYGDKQQDSHTSTLPDGSASITIGYNVTIGFDGTESSGVEKIKNFITSLGADDDNTKKLTKMVNTFLKPNVKTGMLNPSKIIELSKLRDEFNDNEFNDGIDIIFNAQIRRQNSVYVSGWKSIEVDGVPKKVEFRFTV
jgi:hypothetical protein